MFLRNTISYTYYESNATGVKDYYEAIENYAYSLKQNNISIQPVLTYNIYNSRDFKWFIGAGGGFNISSYSKNTQVLTRVALTGTTVTSKEQFIPSINKFWLSGVVRTGITIKNFYIMLSYSPKVNLLQAMLYSLSTSSTQLQAVYLFNAKKK